MPRNWHLGRWTGYSRRPETTDNTLTWTETEADSTLYSGDAGIVLALLEAQRHVGDDRYGDAALRGARSIATAIDECENCSLYFGLTGLAVALRAVGDLLAEKPAIAAADRAMDLVRSRFDGDRWSNSVRPARRERRHRAGCARCR